MNNALIIELRNPSDETHIFRFDAGARVGRMPSNGNIVLSAEAISFSVPGQEHSFHFHENLLDEVVPTNTSIHSFHFHLQQ